MSASIVSAIKLDSTITKLDSQPTPKQSGFKELPLELRTAIFSKMLYAETARIAHVLAKEYQELLPNDGILDLSNAKNLTDQDLINIITKYKTQDKIIVSLNLSGCSRITDRAIGRVAAAFPHLKILNLLDCKRLTFVSLFHIENLQQLTTLTGYKQIRNLSPLAALKQLTTLNLSGGDQITDLSPLKNLTQLTTLNLTCCLGITDLSPLAALTQLTTLNLSWCEITDLSPLAALKQLTTLNLSSCTKITDLSPLAALTQLTTLILSRCEGFKKDLSPLRTLKQLTTLNLTGQGGIKDLSLLATLEQLTTLSLSDCMQITDLSFLAALTQLTTLNLSRCFGIKFENLKLLAPLYQLKTLNVSMTDLDTPPQLNNFRKLQNKIYQQFVLKSLNQSDILFPKTKLEPLHSLISEYSSVMSNELTEK